MVLRRMTATMCRCAIRTASGGWVERRAAARIAGDVFADRLDASGRAPTQVRVISTSKLMREGGQAAVDRAVADIRG